MNSSLCWKHSKHPQKDNVTTLPIFVSKGTVLYNSDVFAAHSDQYFYQKPTPQQCRKIMKFGILFTVNPISPMKTWIKSSRTL